MYPVSQAYKTAIRARTRTDSVTGVLTLKDGTVLALQPQDLISGSLTLDNQCVTGEELAFGCAYMGQAALSLRTELDRYSFYGASLVLTYALQLADGSWERVPLGCYTVAEAERRALYVSIKAYDNILALQTRFDGEALRGGRLHAAYGAGRPRRAYAGPDRAGDCGFEPLRGAGAPADRGGVFHPAGRCERDCPAAGRLCRGRPGRAAGYPAVCRKPLRRTGRGGAQ